MPTHVEFVTTHAVAAVVVVWATIGCRAACAVPVAASVTRAWQLDRRHLDRGRREVHACPWRYTPCSKEDRRR